MNKIIGQLIEEEVRRQGMTMESFANAIRCTRKNVYDIFKRNSVDVPRLQIISQVLNHNFFQDLADNPELAGLGNPEVIKEFENKKAVGQFFDVMPKVLKNLHLETSIVAPILINQENEPLPDYALGDFNVFFTVGERLYDRFTDENRGCFEVQTEYSIVGQPIDVWLNIVAHTWFADVKLDFKTEQQWGNIIIHLIDNCMPVIKKDRRYLQ